MRRKVEFTLELDEGKCGREQAPSHIKLIPLRW
jgi:hypothetical protein